MGWGGVVYMSKIVVHFTYAMRKSIESVANKIYKACTMIYNLLQGYTICTRIYND